MEPVLAVAAALGAGAAGLGWHHSRWVSYHRHKGIPVPPGGTRWMLEETRDLVVLGVWHGVGFLRDGLRSPAEPNGRLVVCVHGYTQNGTNFWGLRRALAEAGRPTVAVSMRHRLAPVGWYVDRLEQALEHAVASVPDRVDVVAHSMGGIVLRAVLARRTDLAERLGGVVTLGSPHRGTAAARGFAWLPEVRALRRRSPWLASLPSLPSLLPIGRVTTVAGSLDTVVYPVASALAEGARQVVLDVGHVGLLTRRSAHRQVLAALDED
ncbi:MAG: triacylglycerol lipase [Myxococcota bacterium]